jgi:hypothetical protein
MNDNYHLGLAEPQFSRSIFPTSNQVTHSVTPIHSENRHQDMKTRNDFKPTSAISSTPWDGWDALGRLGRPGTVGTPWDGWDALGRLWDARKSENRPCTRALGRWDGCTPPRHPLPSSFPSPFSSSSLAPAIYAYLRLSLQLKRPGAPGSIPHRYQASRTIPNLRIFSNSLLPLPGVLRAAFSITHLRQTSRNIVKLH